MKIVIVMTYYERQYQLDKTLRSLSLSSCKDFEVVIVDDASPTPALLPVDPLPFPVHVHRITTKQWTNPEPAYNTGLLIALGKNPDVVILQNAECYHEGDVISHASQLRADEYFSYACFSINERVTFSDHNIRQVIRSNNFGAGHDGQNAWYNHSLHRPVGYDFCAAVPASIIRELNGYDERFSVGMGYGDDFLLHRLKMLPVKFRIIDEPFVVHQWHYNGVGVPEDKLELVRRNRLLFYELLREKNPRAEHIYTQNLDE